MKREPEQCDTAGGHPLTRCILRAGHTGAHVIPRCRGCGEHFCVCEQDAKLAAEAMALAEPSLRQVWGNPTDSAYDED